MTSDAYKRIRFDVMFSHGSNKIYIWALIFLSWYLVCLLYVLIIIILRVLIWHPNPTTPLEKYSEGDTCVVVSPARIQHYFGDHDSCRVQRTPGDGCLDRTTSTLSSEEGDSPKGNNGEKLSSKRPKRSDRIGLFPDRFGGSWKKRYSSGVTNSPDSSTDSELPGVVKCSPHWRLSSDTCIAIRRESWEGSFLHSP